MKQTVENKTRFQKIWLANGSIQELPRGKRHVGFFRKSYNWDEFPTEYVLNYPIDVFKIYVNETYYFMFNLPSLVDTILFDPKESYYQSIIVTWLATYGCGISIQHLIFSNQTPKQVTSIIRFHPYFTVRRLMHESSIMNKQQIN